MSFLGLKAGDKAEVLFTGVVRNVSDTAVWAEFYLEGGQSVEVTLSSEEGNQVGITLIEAAPVLVRGTIITIPKVMQDMPLNSVVITATTAQGLTSRPGIGIAVNVGPGTNRWQFIGQEGTYTVAQVFQALVDAGGGSVTVAYAAT